MSRTLLFLASVAVILMLVGCDEEGIVSVETPQITNPEGPDSPVTLTENLWYCSNPSISYSRPDWMGELPDGLRLSDLSVPATHETMSRFGGPFVECQSVPLAGQLDAGIRAVDIRIRHIEDVLTIHHSAFYQNARFGTDVLQVCIDFLQAHPSETILMRVQKTHSEENITRTLGETFAWYMSMYGYAVWAGDPTTGFDRLPTLGDVRGKIVLLQNFTAVDSQGNSMPPFGIPWTSLVIQDNYIMEPTHSSFNWKWHDIRTHIIAAMTEDPGALYANFLTGACAERYTPGGLYCLLTLFPYHVAYGKTMWFEFCDGMNRRTYEYITSCYTSPGHQPHCAPYLLDLGQHGRLGLIMADFPGRGLIDAIIAHNGLPRLLVNNRAVAVAGGPYVADEGSAVVFDASGSTDFENDPLKYRWDLDGNDIFDTEWSTDPTVTHTWFDDHDGIVQVEVSDGGPVRADRAMTTVTVNNVPPEVTLEPVSSLIPGCILPGHVVQLGGSFVDVGYPDTHTALWRLGDQATLPGTLTETNDPPAAHGSVADSHVYTAPGRYGLVLEVVDDDGGLGAGAMTVPVLTAAEALQFLDDAIRAMPDAAFSGPAGNRKDALSSKLTTLTRMITGGHYKAAMNKIRHDVRAKMDGSVGGDAQDDWIVDAGAQQHCCLVLDEIVGYMTGPYWRGSAALP